MTDERVARLATLRQRADGLREDAKRRPHLRFTIETMVEQLEREARELETAAADPAEHAA